PLIQRGIKNYANNNNILLMEENITIIGLLKKVNKKTTYSRLQKRRSHQWSEFPCFSRKPPIARKIGSELQLKALKSSIKIVLNIFCVRSAVCVKNTETLTIGGIFFFATDFRLSNLPLHIK